jgi:SPP1 gp7 family putative phage head morphogenesis protein
MPEIDLAYAVKLPPRDAIQYFQSKGYQVSWNWWEVWQDAHARAFTVAKATRADVLQAIRDAVDRALTEGRTVRDFARDLKPTLQRLGWWGRQTHALEDGTEEEVTLGTPWRLRNIYRTNLQTAYMAGRYKQQLDDIARRPYWQYVAVLDARTRPAHRAMHGKVFRADDPFWDSFYPPNGWGCRCRVRALNERRLEAQGIAPESSAGRLQDFEVDAGVDKRTGEIVKAKVKGIRYTDERGQAQWFKTDAGWSYNPGKAAWTPDKSRWVPDLAKAYERSVGATVPELLQGLQRRKLDDYLKAGESRLLEVERHAAATGQPFRSALREKLKAARSFDTAAKVKSAGKGAETVRQASKLYPDDWTRKADAFGPLYAKAKTNSRGWAATLPETRGYVRFRLPEFGEVEFEPNAGYIVVRPGDIENAVHEYGHRLQAALPELNAFFTDLHRRRTAGDPLKPLRNWSPGYRANEMTREDKYVSPYQGKEYDGEPLEMLTMAFEWVLGPRLAAFEEFRAKDPEMFNLVIGLLFEYTP